MAETRQSAFPRIVGEHLGWRLRRCWNAVSLRAVPRARQDERDAIVSAAFSQMSEDISDLIEIINKFKAVEETDTRDNLHNTRKDLLSFQAGMAETFEQVKSLKDAKDWQSTAEQGVKFYSLAVLPEIAKRLERRGYFAWDNPSRPGEQTGEN